MSSELKQQLKNERLAVKKLVKTERTGCEDIIVIYSDKVEMYRIDVINGIGTIQTIKDTNLNWNFINEQGYKEA